MDLEKEKKQKKKRTCPLCLTLEKAKNEKNSSSMLDFKTNRYQWNRS